ncbi:helix-turn-helix domain-containing protein [Pseudomarimonas arenosa]|uniref:Helix-turn-helix transcriptional regulator n=1 Tax=Pseudomarimonas arenosa TaxID=2774145 RepID=A0AAW3ZIY0_9GAMM|nr:helix-turn-helix transcriptional regulator [Pseudomarimonas arenosa]MBD8524426.1 helix-turn-helix transcriptional regulator [Pseudomarimonas arenosa]
MSRRPKSISPLPSRIREAREAIGLSQSRLGELAGLDPSVASARINQYERAVHEPKFQMVVRMAEALGVPTAYLYCQEDEMAEVILKHWRQH